MAIDKITKIDENFVLEGTHVVVPTGTTAQRPSGPDNGYVRYNTTIGSLEFYNGTDGTWVSTNLIPSIDTLDGNINDGYNATLKFTTSNTTDTITVVFKNSSGVEIAESTNVDTTTQPFYVDIPSAVTSAVSSGDSVSVLVQNADGTPSSSVTKTVIAAPTGGTVTTYTSGADTYRVHTFLSSGTFTHAEDLTVDELIVAGGGGGAAGGGTGDEAGGGGGAGGYVVVTGATLTTATSPRTVTVGAGGAGRAGGTSGNTGGTGGFSNVVDDSQATAAGGGGGGQQNVDGADGGSGGGGGGLDTGEPNTLGGSGTSGQGTAGGGNPGYNQGDMGGGGGGASQSGQNVTGQGAGGGDGGDGHGNAFRTGSNVTYAGGGGGGANTGQIGVGGAGGGGDGAVNGSGSNGTANTGGGGGGGDGGSTISGGNGGSGIVVIRYKTDQVSA